MKFSSPNRWLHVAMLCCVMVEVAELEIFTSGAAHHIWDALIVGLFTTVSARIAAKPRYAFLVLFLGGTAWTIDLFGLRWPPADLESLFWFLFHTVPALMLLRRIFTVERITLVEVVDAVCLYLLVGLAFACLYGAVQWHHPGALTHASVAAGERLPYSLVVYYSFTSQLTMGYGDILPAHKLTRTISIAQGLFGVMYVAILISWFVSLHSAAYFSRRGADHRPLRG